MIVYYIIVKHSAPMLSYCHHSKCLILYLKFADSISKDCYIFWFEVSFV